MYAFDIHCNAYFPLFLLLNGKQLTVAFRDARICNSSYELLCASPESTNLPRVCEAWCISSARTACTLQWVGQLNIAASLNTLQCSSWR